MPSRAQVNIYLKIILQKLFVSWMGRGLVFIQNMKLYMDIQFMDVFTYKLLKNDNGTKF